MAKFWLSNHSFVYVDALFTLRKLTLAYSRAFVMTIAADIYSCSSVPLMSNSSTILFHSLHSNYRSENPKKHHRFFSFFYASFPAVLILRSTAGVAQTILMIESSVFVSEKFFHLIWWW